MFFRFTALMQRVRRVLRKRLRRNQVLGFFSRLPRCVVGLEARATAQYWARELGALGHEVRLMPAHLSVPCVRAQWRLYFVRR